MEAVIDELQWFEMEHILASVLKGGELERQGGGVSEGSSDREGDPS